MPNERWVAASVVSKTNTLNSYWIVCENGTQQPKTYMHTGPSLKVRSIPTDGEQNAQQDEWRPETGFDRLVLPAVLNEHAGLSIHNSVKRSSKGSSQLLLPTLDLQNSEKCSQKREEDGQQVVLLYFDSREQNLT